ncbi:RsmG [Paenibacillus mucilaginosus 3016]|uniref:Ribosomal RNA small subunit methyltransferase G n=1 Tax=Paenibacillus mucilaginosus 3016 TaxID=1116391 RepID=H6NIZ8_9BACL|nr:16S rRNA (guanine(527)-N(7))-methyltransferase RsmG [Paenibacillus mucilaginosus]AFC34048.1 RsmG [Paenibacillus mucilaginosus 3016]WFA22413.1 16S rRNA (guanine(527)-N(7))-methyltransferase RsmG [Paenibacillus mucilaginosus]
MDAVQQQFVEMLEPHGIALNEHQLSQFEIYYKELVDWNERMNLTGITERDQVYLKHFFDSLSLAFYVPVDDHAALADIGSGAGFPSIPLIIAFPHLQVTIVDSLNKRIQFLNHLTMALGLSNVTCVHGRAEDVARGAAHRDSYDLVTARAVARLAVLNEFCLPFTSVDGLFVAMKGQDIGDELKEAGRSLQELHAKVVETHRFILPIEESVRHLVITKKIDSTPAKYPRKAGLPMKEPLLS